MKKLAYAEELDRPEKRPNLPKKKIDNDYKKLEVLKVEYVPTDSIYPNPYNPNRQSEREFELLMKSIKEDGFTQPVIVHSTSKQIVDGEHRWRALNRLGFKEIAVVFVDMSAAQMRVATLRHNRARGSEDIELSIKVLRDLRELGALDHAIDSLGMDEKELNLLIDDLNAPEMLSSEQFSSGWVPSGIAEEPAHQQFKNKEAHVHEKTKKMREDIRDNMTEAKSLKELGEQNKKGAEQFISVSISLKGEDAIYVKKVLGDNPAEKLLRMACNELCENLDMQDDVKMYVDWFVTACREAIGKAPQSLIDRM